MNEALNNIMSRRSTRKYKPDMIPEDVLERIIAAGVAAPTASNKQSPIIIAVTNKEMRDKLSRMNAATRSSDRDPFFGAPVVLVVLADKNIYTRVYDGSVVLENMQLAATAEGIGCCWIHRAKEEFETEEGKQILKDLGIEGEYEGIGHCILGYTDNYVYPEIKRKDNYVYYIK